MTRITFLAEARIQDGESRLRFLNRKKRLVKRGGLPNNVPNTKVLRAIPFEFTNRIVIGENNLAWDSL